MNDDHEVCYEVVGCFSRLPPFNNAGGRVPDPPQELTIDLQLYIPGRAAPFKLDYLHRKSVVEAEFDPSLPAKVIVHGFGSTLGVTPWITEMKDAFVRKSDSNIILVGWDTHFPDYPRAVANTRLVARVVAMVIRQLRSSKGLELTKVHLIGHSLGAHISGYVGHLLGSRVGRITGLDPAGPMFATHPADVRLDPSDAIFVDVIHSNGEKMGLGGGFGLMLPSGHVDFYPNGGKKQRGCKDGAEGAVNQFLENFSNGGHSNQSFAEGMSCSHSRSHEIFTESIMADSCAFKAFPCPSYVDFLQGKCKKCGPKGCNSAGLQASPKLAGGLQFFQTNKADPFCGQSYLVTIVPGLMTESLFGLISVTLKGTNGELKATLAVGSILMSQDEPLKRVVPSDMNLGAISKVDMIYHRALFATGQLVVGKILIEPLGQNRTFVSLKRNFGLSKTKEDMQMVLMK